MTSYSMQKIGPLPGVLLPNVPIISSTPNTILNIVNRSEIVTSPGKGTNDLQSISNNLPSTQVYLDTNEKYQNNSITSSNSFSIPNQPLDLFKDDIVEYSQEQYEPIGPEDKDTEDLLLSAIINIYHEFTEKDGPLKGLVNRRRCKVFAKQAQEMKVLLDEIIREGTGLEPPKENYIGSDWVKHKSRDELEDFALRWERAVDYGRKVDEDLVRTRKYYTDRIDELNGTIRQLGDIIDRFSVTVPPSIDPSGASSVATGTAISNTATVISQGRPLKRTPGVPASPTQSIGEPGDVPTVLCTSSAPTWIGGFPTNNDLPVTPPVIRKPTDYCHCYHTLLLLGRICPDCEKNRSITFCQDLCPLCTRKTKAFDRAEDRVDTNHFVQIIKTKRVNELRARANTSSLIPVASHPSVPSPQPLLPSLQLNRCGNFLDKFLAVTYTLKDTDLTKDNILHLEHQLIRNFLSLTFLKDFPCKGSVYVIEYTQSLVPHLHGIIRLSTDLKKNKNITVQNAHFDGRNKITKDGKEEPRDDKVKILLKPINVSGWIAYMEKYYVIKGHRDFVGDLGKIIDGWDYQPSPPICPF